MGTLLGILMIVLGLLASSSFIVSYAEDAGPIIEKLRPAQGWLGLIGAIAGVLLVVNFLLGMGGKHSPSAVALVRSIGGSALLAATGFLMGFGMISSMLASNEEAQERADELYERLISYQVPLGLASIGVGIWALIG